MQYYPLPEDVVEDIESLRPWVDKAVAVARHKRAARSRRGRGR
jgi:hypothetical protein